MAAIAKVGVSVLGVCDLITIQDSVDGTAGISCQFLTERSLLETWFLAFSQ